MADNVVRLGGSEGRTLEVRVEGVKKAFQVPLADALRVGDAMAFRKARALPEEERGDALFDAFYAFVCRYVPQKYIDMLSMDDLGRLSDAWEAASSEGEVGPGE